MVTGKKKPKKPRIKRNYTIPGNTGLFKNCHIKRRSFQRVFQQQNFAEATFPKSSFC